jgi:hypothetical protein
VYSRSQFITNNTDNMSIMNLQAFENADQPFLKLATSYESQWTHQTDAIQEKKNDDHLTIGNLFGCWTRIREGVVGRRLVTAP